MVYLIRDTHSFAVDGTILPSMKYNYTIMVGGSNSLVGHLTDNISSSFFTGVTLNILINNFETLLLKKKLHCHIVIEHFSDVGSMFIQNIHMPFYFNICTYCIYMYCYDTCLIIALHIICDKFYIQMVSPCMDLWECIINE
jgi:hypothetical protein